MDLEKLGNKDNRLSALLAQSQKWRRLDREVKQLMPANLRPHFQTACVENGVLVLLAGNNMALSRLRMIAPGMLVSLQGIEPEIQEVRVKAVPKPLKPVRENSLVFSQKAVESMQDAAVRVRHHPELAQALRKLAEKYGMR